MGLRDWIYAFIDSVPRIISNPARWIADRIWAVLDDGVRFAKWLKSGFSNLYNQIKAFLYALLRILNETIVTFQWLISSLIPKSLTQLSKVLRQWASGVINNVIRTLSSAIAALRTYADKAINFVADAIKSLAKWAVDKIAFILDYLAKTVARWYQRLEDPSKFATWLIAAMLSPLLKYLHDQRDKIAGWFLRTSTAFTMWLARELSSIISRLL